MMNVANEYDWIVVGSGAAGLAGALSGAALGGRVLLVEKSDKLGGGTAYSYGALWAGANPMQAAAGIEDDVAQAETYLQWLAGGFGDRQRLLRMARDSGEALAFFGAQGIPFRLIRNLPDHYYPEAPGSIREGRDLEVVPFARADAGVPPEAVEEAPYLPPGVSWSDTIAWGGMGRKHAWDQNELRRREPLYAAGQGLAAWFIRRCTKAGVQFLPGAGLQRLLVEDGGVAGVEVFRGDERRAIRSRRGVLLATGGYEGNSALVRAYEAFPDQPNHFPAGLTGDGLIAAAEIGALISVMPLKLQVMLGYRIPADEHGHEFRSAGIQELAAPHTVVVNADGQRFADESFFQETMCSLRIFDVHKHHYANLPCYLLFDSQFASQHSFAGGAPGLPIPAWVARGTTIRELAAELHIDADRLEATLHTFNEGARRGEDPVFHRGHLAWARLAGEVSGRDNPNLGTVEKAPFYGVRLEPSGTAGAGVTADDRARVQHVRGHHIPGLYAAGNVSTCTEYGAGFQAGLTLMSGLLFGLWAARTAFAVE